MPKTKSVKKSSSQLQFKQSKSGRTLRSHAKSTTVEDETHTVKKPTIQTQLDMKEFAKTQKKTETAEKNAVKSVDILAGVKQSPTLKKDLVSNQERIIESLLGDRDSLIQKLRDFDLATKFGPCVGISRLERWNRAKKLKLDPPEDIGILLKSEVINDDPELREGLWFNVL